MSPGSLRLFGRVDRSIARELASPVLAMWLPNLVFAPLAVLWLLRAPRGLSGSRG